MGDNFVCIGFSRKLRQSLQLPQKLIHSATKCKHYPSVDEEELQYIENHSSKTDLQWSKVWMDRKYVDQFHETQYIGGPKF